MLCKFFDKKTKSGMCVNKQLPQELDKPVIKKFKGRRVHAMLKENIWASELDQMESLPFFNCAIQYLLSVIDVFSKYVWVKPIKDKKEKEALNGFVEIVD